MAAEAKPNRYIFFVFIATILVFVLYYLREFIPAFLGALMFYILSKPFYCWLTGKKGWNKILAAMLIIVITLIAVILPLSFIIGLMYSKLSALLSHPEVVTGSLTRINNTLQSKYHIDVVSDKNIAAIKSNISQFLPVFINKSVSAISVTILMSFFQYYMTINSGKMEAAARLYLPFKREDLDTLGKTLVTETYSNSVSIPVVNIAAGLAALLAYEIIGLPQSGLWAIITGIATVIPIIGAAIVWVLVAVYMFIAGSNWQAIFMIIYGLLVLSTIDNIVRFLVAKKVAHVHPIVTVLGVIVGVQLFGFLGLIFGPLIISYLLILMKIYYLENLGKIKGEE